MLERNLFRWRMVLIAREYKAVFVGENGQITVQGERVLADIRDFCHVSAPTIFDPDALVMARREGRREAGLRIIRMLGLDEDQVQKLMEVDDE